MTKEEELKLGEELARTDSSLMVRLSKSEFYDVYPLFTYSSYTSRNRIEVEGIVINHYYTKDKQLQHLYYDSTANEHPEVLRDFEAAIETNKYEIQRHYINYKER